MKVLGIAISIAAAAIYSRDSPAASVRWIRDEILPYASRPAQEVFDE